MRVMVLVAAVLVLPSLWFMLRYAPTGRHLPDQSRVPENPLRAVMALAHNKPMLWYFAAAILHTLAGAFFIALEFMMMESWLGVGQYYVHFTLFHLLVASAAITPASRLITRLGKIQALMLAYSLNIAASLVLMVVLLNNAQSLLLFVIFQAVWALTSAMGNIAVFSLLSDVSDYSTLKTGVDRSATIFSLSSLSSKTCMALGIAASIALAAWFGFDPASDIQGPNVYWGLTLCMCILPILFNLLSIGCVSKTAITESRHAIIRRRLDAAPGVSNTRRAIPPRPAW